VAHALEQTSNYQLPHGEAVALGLIVECRLAERLGIAPGGLWERVADLLTRFGLPVRLPPELRPASVLGSMATDKKNRSDRIHFALPTRLGAMHRGTNWTIPVEADAIREALIAAE
jgi:3-dehydroquinate synthase